MGILYADHEYDRTALTNTGSYQVGIDRVERLMQHLISDLDRLCVWGGFRGLQRGSNEAAPIDLAGTEHAMQRVRHLIAIPRFYCSTALSHVSETRMQTTRASVLNLRSRF